ncbi:MAG: hypothetical protein V4560_19085 [Bacteroidota bacterium]
MTGEEYKKFSAQFKVTDPNIYDVSGNIVDSVVAKKMIRTYEYEMSVHSIEGGGAKRVIHKVDHVLYARMDKETMLTHHPNSEKLQEGVTLDLNPLANRTDLSKLDGKAIVLIFWKPQYRGMYAQVNEVIEDFIGTNKFDVFAITHLSYDAANEYLKKYPINAHQVIDAPGIVDFYGIDDEPVIVITNAQHQITYSIKGSVALIARTLHKALKEL